MAGRPLVTFDIDGVLCRPPFGINPGGPNARSRDPVRIPRLSWPVERWFYGWRRPMPGAREGFHAIAARFAIATVSARAESARGVTGRWLERELGASPPLHLRPTWRERSSAFKARVIPALGAFAHFEDDPNTALLLAARIPCVFLVDWPRNRGVAHPGVHRIGRIAEALPLLEESAARA